MTAPPIDICDLENRRCAIYVYGHGAFEGPGNVELRLQSQLGGVGHSNLNGDTIVAIIGRYIAVVARISPENSLDLDSDVILHPRNAMVYSVIEAIEVYLHFDLARQSYGVLAPKVMILTSGSNANGYLHNNAVLLSSTLLEFPGQRYEQLKNQIADKLGDPNVFLCPSGSMLKGNWLAHFRSYTMDPTAIRPRIAIWVTRTIANEVEGFTYIEPKVAVDGTEQPLFMGSVVVQDIPITDQIRSVLYGYPSVPAGYFPSI